MNPKTALDGVFRRPVHKLLAVLAVVVAGSAHAGTLPRHNPVPGGIAIVPLAIDSDAPPTVYFGGQRVLVTRGESAWLAVIGIPLDIQGSSHRLTVSDRATGSEQLFDIENKDYPVQYVTLNTNRHVEPDPEQLARFEREREILVKAFSTWNEMIFPDLRFDPPLRGRVTGTFGSRRFFNDQPRQPHRGIDIAMPEGTPVAAPAPGVVLETGDFFFNGNTVLLDHGHGVVSMYCHLKTVDVKPGQTLARGEKLGEVGKTGRATGPHLHWTISLNNSAVDPLLFLEPNALDAKRTPAKSQKTAGRDRDGY